MSFKSLISRTFYFVSNSTQRSYSHRPNVSPQFFILEAFTIGAQQGTGNPAGVCVLEFDDEILDEAKQRIASTLNLSVTAFVSRDWKKSDELSLQKSSDLKTIKRTLRWFTPTKEIFLCGHATLATAFSLVHLEPMTEKIEFSSKSRGILEASFDKSNDLINLHFPSNSTIKMSFDESPWLLNLTRIVLGLSFDPFSSIQDAQYCPKESILLLRLKKNLNEKSLETIQKVCPNFDQLLKTDTGEMLLMGVIVTIEGDKEIGEPDFYSRFFAPQIGINEDYATGSSHTILTPYWTKELGIRTLKARQASGRGGDLKCLVDEDGVILAGKARILVQGQINI